MEVALKFEHRNNKVVVMVLLMSGKFRKCLKFTIKESKETTTSWSWTCWGLAKVFA